MPLATMLSGEAHQPLDPALGEIAPFDCCRLSSRPNLN